VNPDTVPGNVFAAAVQWVEGTLLGTVATSVAVIAVAAIGLLLLSGRIDVRRAVQVIFGCFILFGASSIAAGIMHSATIGSNQLEPPPAPMPPVNRAVPSEQPPKAVPYDPYAGAAMPVRR